MKKIIIAVAVTAAAFTLTACGARTDNVSVSKAPESVAVTTPVSTPTSETNYGNTSGNISNNAFVAQDGDNIFYVLPTNPGTELHSGDLIKTNADGSTKSVLFSGGRPLCLNVVDGWIYYISSHDGLIYKMREDGTEKALITSADTQSGFMQGYTTQNLRMVGTMTVIDDTIYCRVLNSDRTKELYKINADSGEVKQLQNVGVLTSGLVVYKDWIYYCKSEDNIWATYRMRTDGTENTKIADYQISSVCIENDKIYCLCKSGNSGVQIYSMDLDGSNSKPIADGITATRINAAGGWIYFTDTAAIYKIKTDGTEKMKLCDFPSSNFIDMNVLDGWIYLTGNGFNMQKLKTDGSQLQEVK